jgi:hypothetical protein
MIEESQQSPKRSDSDSRLTQEEDNNWSRRETQLKPRSSSKKHNALTEAQRQQAELARRQELVKTRDPAQVLVVIQESQHAERSAATAVCSSGKTRTVLDARPSSSPGRHRRITTR